MGVVLSMPIDLEVIPIIAIKPILGTQPHKSPMVLGNAVDGGLRESIAKGKMVEFERLGIGVPSAHQHTYDDEVGRGFLHNLSYRLRIYSF